MPRASGLICQIFSQWQTAKKVTVYRSPHNIFSDVTKPILLCGLKGNKAMCGNTVSSSSILSICIEKRCLCSLPSSVKLRHLLYKAKRKVCFEHSWNSKTVLSPVKKLYRQQNNPGINPSPTSQGFKRDRYSGSHENIFIR